MKKNFKKVIIGGTFETLHKGHLALFKRAFELGSPPHQIQPKPVVAKGYKAKPPIGSCYQRPPHHREIWCGGGVLIGLTSDKMAERQRKRKVKDFKERKRDLEGFLQKEFSIKPKIVKIEDKFGPALKGDFDYIIVSPETEKTAVMLNEKRIKRGKKPIEIVEINFVLAEDGKPISDSRILEGEIDKAGKLLYKK